MHGYMAKPVDPELLLETVGLLAVPRGVNQATPEGREG